MNSKIRIDLSIDEIKNAIIKYLYHEQKISGIFDVNFKLIRNNHNCSFDGAVVIIDPNMEDKNEINRTNL